MRKSVYGIYAPDHDITFVMEEYLTDDGEFVSTEVKGFYFGEPTEIDNETFYGDLKAEFDNPELTNEKKYKGDFKNEYYRKTLYCNR